MVVGIGNTISDAIEDLRLKANEYDESIWYESE